MKTIFLKKNVNEKIKKLQKLEKTKNFKQNNFEKIQIRKQNTLEIFKN